MAHHVADAAKCIGTFNGGSTDSNMVTVDGSKQPIFFIGEKSKLGFGLCLVGELLGMIVLDPSAIFAISKEGAKTFQFGFLGGVG